MKAKPYLIQGAMDIEVDALIATLSEPHRIDIAGWAFWTGEIYKHPVVISCTEVGLTNAAAATAIAIERFAPKAIINQGTSGGHITKLYRGDIVIGERIVNIGAYQTDFLPAGAGSKQDSWHVLTSAMRTRCGDARIEHPDGFFSDKELLIAAQKVPYMQGKMITGVIGSADQWNREVDRINMLHDKYGTSVEEMEAVAAAQVATAYNIPYIAIRIVSNTDLRNQNFAPKTGLQCQEFVLKYLEALVQ